MSDPAAFVDDAQDLPVMPPVAAEVMRKAQDPETDCNDIAELISRDAALAARVLKIANSSFYSMPRSIDTIQQGVVLLGYATLHSIVVAASMKDVFSRFGLAERVLWEHAVAAAVATSLLSQEVAGLATDDVFVAGLLHDVGKLVMHAEAGERFQEVMGRVYGEDADVQRVEREVFGFDHCDVGRLVLEKWKLPPRLTSAVGSHHDPSSAPDQAGGKPLAAVLQVADLLCLREGLGRRKPNPEIQPLSCAGAEILGISHLDVEGLTGEFRERYDHEREVFG